MARMATFFWLSGRLNLLLCKSFFVINSAELVLLLNFSCIKAEPFFEFNKNNCVHMRKQSSRRINNLS